jgi:hypothetical protein
MLRAICLGGTAVALLLAAVPAAPASTPVTPAGWRVTPVAARIESADPDIPIGSCGAQTPDGTCFPAGLAYGDTPNDEDD